MRLASYRTEGADSFGIVTDHGIIDLRRRTGFTSLLALIAGDGLAAAHAHAGEAPDVDPARITWLPPVLGEKLWCIGVNYAERNEEYRDASAAPAYPSLFCRNPRSFVGHNVPVERPRVSALFDYEGEIALVIGKPGRHIKRERAFEHIFGLTLCNEGSVRDWLRHGKFNVTQGKNFDRSGSLGPWIATADETDPRRPLELTTRVNGEIRQHDSTARLMFPFDFLIAYLSTFATLVPGDIIVTGTPTGAGVHRDPPVWLVPGDLVEVEVPGIGLLSNTVADEPG
jgi:2-keto-4-pentenoate hydratase/2-oxohepta-3-ene-1,7-dioic acid hydratase in catechol pathway